MILQKRCGDGRGCKSVFEQFPQKKEITYNLVAPWMKKHDKAERWKLEEDSDDIPMYGHILGEALHELGIEPVSQRMILYFFGESVCLFAAIEFVIFCVIKRTNADLSGGFWFSYEGAEKDIGERVEPAFLGDHTCIDDAGIHSDNAVICLIRFTAF